MGWTDGWIHGCIDDEWIIEIIEPSGIDRFSIHLDSRFWVIKTQSNETSLNPQDGVFVGAPVAYLSRMMSFKRPTSMAISTTRPTWIKDDQGIIS